MEKSTPFIGLNVHKDSIEVAIAHQGEVRHCARFASNATAVDETAR
jgi:hypothetical protein